MAENATPQLLLPQWTPYLVLGVIFRGPFSDMGGKAGVKLDPGAEGLLLAGDMVAFSWPAAAGPACKSGAIYHSSERDYHYATRRS